MKKRTMLIVVGIICLLGACACGMYIYLHTGYTPPTVSALMTPAPTAVPTPTPEPTAEPTATPEPTPTPSPSPTPYVSPVDFASLQAINPDIYAWIRIDNTNIDYPVLQSGTDDNFYLDHDSDGNYSANGSIFTDHIYNSLAFDDPLTVLYGHRMNSGEMFGNLRNYYTDSAFFQENNIIKIYTPDALLEYKIFLCTDYSNASILYHFDFDNESSFNSFFDEIYNSGLVKQLDESAKPVFGQDKIIVLSTCLQSNRSMRFLVMGVLQP